MPQKEGCPEFSDNQIKARIIHNQEQYPTRWNALNNETQTSQATGGILPIQLIERHLDELDTLYDNFMDLFSELVPDATEQQTLDYALGIIDALGIIPTNKTVEPEDQ